MMIFPSVKVAEGYKAILHADDNFSGAFIELTSDNNCLTWSANLHDKTSSIKVRSASGKWIQAEDFSGMFRVQTQSTSDTDGGLNVGWVDSMIGWFTMTLISLPLAHTRLNIE